MLRGWLFAFALLGLRAEEPTLVVQGKQTGVQGTISWQSQGSAEYRLCAYWDGPRDGMPSRELFQPVEFCRIYPGRIFYTLQWLKADMLRCLRAPNPQDVDDREQAAWLMALGIPMDQLVQRIQGVTDASLQAVTARLVTWVAIHEGGHACGLEGHLNGAKIEDAACANPVSSCPMQYMDRWAKRRLVLFGEVPGTGTFCNSSPHHCYRHLTSKR
jgi:hypothetical protein